MEEQMIRLYSKEPESHLAKQKEVFLNKLHPVFIKPIKPILKAAKPIQRSLS